MKRERKGVSAVIIYEKNGFREYLILKRKLNWRGWELLKGGLRPKEEYLKALKREIKEEIGLKSGYNIIPTSYWNSFKYGKEYVKDGELYGSVRNKVFLVKLRSKKIKIDSKEHSGFRWVGKKDALKMLTWKDQKSIIKKF